MPVAVCRWWSVASRGGLQHTQPLLLPYCEVLPRPRAWSHALLESSAAMGIARVGPRLLIHLVTMRPRAPQQERERERPDSAGVADSRDDRV